MSTTANAPQSLSSKARDMRVAVVRTLWNSKITEPLMAGALEEFKSAGLEAVDVDTFEVPGAIELTFAASKLIETGLYDAIVVLGCVIRGGTQSVTQGITHLNAECDIPVIFGVLTVDNEQDAIDRAGGKEGNKGAEAARAALLMYDFVEQVEDI